MANTTPQYGWPIPAYTDPADGPGALRALGVAIEGTLRAGLTPAATTTAGTLAALPATVPGAGSQYVVTSGTGTGLVFLSTGNAWVAVGSVAQLLRALGKAATDVPLQVSGIAGQSGDLAQFLNSAGTILARITPRGTYIGPTAPRKVLGYTNGQLATVTITDAAGTTTLSTQTLTYDATTGNLSQVVTVSEGRTLTQAMTYDGSGNLTLVTETVS